MNTQAELQALRQTISRQVGLSTYENLNVRCLTALERILSHVVVCLDGDRDAPVDGSDLVEVVMDALDRAKLLEGLTRAEPRVVVDMAAILKRCRAYAASSDRGLFATRGGEILTIVLGDSLGVNLRTSSILNRLLAVPGDGPWYLVAMRPGPRWNPLKGETEAAERIAAACRLVDVPLAGIYLDVQGAKGNKTHTLVEVKAEEVVDG